MNALRWSFVLVVAGLSLAPGLVHAGSTAGSSGPRSAASWEPVPPDDVRARLAAWLDQSPADRTTRDKALAAWDSAGPAVGADPLARLAQSLAVADPRARALVELCSQPHIPGALPKLEWLAERTTPAFFAANLRLFYGRWLALESLFDEAHDQLAGLDQADVIDPAALLFYQAVVYHRLLDRTEGLRAIARLLSGSQVAPRRYVAVARLMQEDLQGLKNDTLDHIARRMDDIHRRLDLGRAGPKVRKVEDGVIESLDKLIKKIEEQQQQQQASAGKGSKRSSSPAPDSMPLEGKGPGEVTKRNIGDKSGWGNISAKQREEAIQQIGRDLPPHYRDLIEQYFRQLANEE